MATLVAIGLWFALVALIPIVARSEANCTDPEDNWMFNSVGLSPCHVAEQLVQPCYPGGFNIPPLPSGDSYFGPSINQVDSCKCTSVYYSLLSACAACQGDTWITWTRFTTNCSSVWVTVYPNTIPAGVKVPHWAYLDVSAANTFSAFAAMNAGGPESSSLASATSSSTSGSAGSSTSSPSVGVIAGAVIGGVVGLALIAGVAIYFYRRPGLQAPDQTKRLASGPDVLSTPAPIVWTGSPLQRALRPQKFYDPQDPSTYPWNPYANSSNVSQSLTGTTCTTSHQQMQRPPHQQVQQPPHQQVQQLPHQQVQRPPHQQVQQPPHQQVQQPPHQQVQRPPHQQVQRPPRQQVQRPPHNPTNYRGVPEV